MNLATLGNKTNTEYRELIEQAAADETTIDQAKLAGLLVLLGKSLATFREDVADKKAELVEAARKRDEAIALDAQADALQPEIDELTTAVANAKEKVSRARLELVRLKSTEFAAIAKFDKLIAHWEGKASQAGLALAGARSKQQTARRRACELRGQQYVAPVAPQVATVGWVDGYYYNPDTSLGLSRLEGATVLNEQGVTPAQIADILGLFTRHGHPDVVRALEEIACPGTHTGEGWIDPREAPIRARRAAEAKALQEQQEREKREQEEFEAAERRRKEALKPKRKPPPESLESLINQDLSDAQIFTVADGHYSHKAIAAERERIKREQAERAARELAEMDAY